MADILTGSKILVIDDHPYFGINIKYNLERFGCIVETAETGDQGIARARELLPDVILVDYIMPAKDGIQTCKEIKAIAALKDIPLVMFTSEAVPSVLNQAIQIGISDFIVKTSGIDIVVEKIEKILKKRPKA